MQTHLQSLLEDWSWIVKHRLVVQACQAKLVVVGGLTINTVGNLPVREHKHHCEHTQHHSASSQLRELLAHTRLLHLQHRHGDVRGSLGSRGMEMCKGVFGSRMDVHKVFVVSEDCTCGVIMDKRDGRFSLSLFTSLRCSTCLKSFISRNRRITRIACKPQWHEQANTSN
jgi:hypothetical protein